MLGELFSDYASIISITSQLPSIPLFVNQANQGINSELHTDVLIFSFHLNMSFSVRTSKYLHWIPYYFYYWFSFFFSYKMTVIYEQ